MVKNNFFLEGSRNQNFLKVQHLQFWNSPWFENSGMVKIMEILDYNFCERVLFMKFLTVPELETSWIIQNFKTGRVTDWMIDWLNDWLIDWLTNWLTEWLIDSLQLLDWPWLVPFWPLLKLDWSQELPYEFVRI